MECINPSPLSDEELNFALDDLADENTMHHLEVCEYCRKRFQKMQRFDNSLTAQLRRVDCPVPQKWIDYDAGFLSETEVNAMSRHLEECPHCRSELDTLKRFLELPTGDENDMLPSNVQPVYFPKWVLQASQINISGNLALKGADDLDGEFQFDVKSGSARIFLEFKQENTGYLLTGQVIDAENDWSGAIAYLTWDDEQLITLLDETAEFRFELLGSNTVTLRVTGRNGLMIVINGISIE